MSNLINVTNIDWDLDEKVNDLPKNLIAVVSEADYCYIIECGMSDILVNLLSDFYGFCIKSLSYSPEIPEIPANTFLDVVNFDR